MRNIFTIFVLSFICLTSALATNPTQPINIVETENILITADNADIFTTAQFDADRQNFEFNTIDRISYIQIYNEQGDLEFQLPVMSNKVSIGKSIFGEGDYKIGFMMAGQKDIQFTQLTIR